MVISWEPYFLAIVWCINIWAEYLSLSLVSPHCLWCSRSWISQFTDIHTQIASVWTVSHTERLFKLVSIWWIIQSCPSLLPLYISVLGGCPCVKDEPLRSEWLCKQNLLSYRIAAIKRVWERCTYPEWARDTNAQQYRQCHIHKWQWVMDCFR